MRGFTKHPSWLVPLLAGVAFTAHGAPKRLSVLETPAFMLYSTEREATMQQLAANLIAFDKVVRSAVGSVSQQTIPLRIFIISRDEWERVFKPARTTQSFHVNTLIFSEIVAPATGRVKRALYHGYTHYLMRDQVSGTGVVWQPWFAEGLAALLMSIEFRDGSAKFEAPLDEIVALKYLPWMSVQSVLEIERTAPEFQDHRLTYSFHAQSALMVLRIGGEAGVLEASDRLHDPHRPG